MVSSRQRNSTVVQSGTGETVGECAGANPLRAGIVVAVLLDLNTSSVIRDHRFLNRIDCSVTKLEDLCSSDRRVQGRVSQAGDAHVAVPKKLIAVVRNPRHGRKADGAGRFVPLRVKKLRAASGQWPAAFQKTTLWWLGGKAQRTEGKQRAEVWQQACGGDYCLRSS